MLNVRKIYPQQEENNCLICGSNTPNIIKKTCPANGDCEYNIHEQCQNMNAHWRDKCLICRRSMNSNQTLENNSSQNISIIIHNMREHNIRLREINYNTQIIINSINSNPNSNSDSQIFNSFLLFLIVIGIISIIPIFTNSNSYMAVFTLIITIICTILLIFSIIYVMLAFCATENANTRSNSRLQICNNITFHKKFSCLILIIFIICLIAGLLNDIKTAYIIQITTLLIGWSAIYVMIKEEDDDD